MAPLAVDLVMVDLVMVDLVMVDLVLCWRWPGP